MSRACLLAVLLIALPSLGFATVFHVYPSTPDPYEVNLLQALQAAVPGDTVLLGPGTYHTTIGMVGGVTLTSKAGPRETIIDGGGQGSVITCSYLWPPATISGLTLKNGAAEFGGGLYCGASAIRFVGNIVTECEATYGVGYGGGIYMETCTPETIIQDNLIIGNHAEIGGGVCTNAVDRSTIIGNTIVGNVSTHAGGIIAYNGCHNDFIRNIIVHNTATYCGGLYVHSSSLIDIGCNDVWGNSPNDYQLASNPLPVADFTLDPLFCGEVEGSFTLDLTSPCLPGQHPDGADCGRIGAFGVGCPVAGVPEPGAGVTLGLAATVPFRAGSTITLSSPIDGSGEVSLYAPGGECRGTIWSGPVEAGITTFTWDGHTATAGRPLPSGVYFLRARVGSATAACRTLLIR